ncbi:MAG: hypothetical protein WC984_01845 [Bacteroidales bacterium]
MKRAGSKELFIYNDKTRAWAISSGGGTEVQYHINFDNKEIGYGLGFNTQYVQFKNNMSSVEYMKPFADAYIYLLEKKDETIVKLKDAGFHFMFGEENELINLENNRYLLFGDTIEVT